MAALKTFHLGIIAWRSLGKIPAVFQEVFKTSAESHVWGSQDHICPSVVLALASLTSLGHLWARRTSLRVWLKLGTILEDLHSNQTECIKLSRGVYRISNSVY